MELSYSLRALEMSKNRFSWKSFLSSADELVDLLSVSKIDFLTRLGKQVLPEGFWGEVSLEAEGSENDLPVVYLTFDDGPDPRTTPYLLEVLEEANVKATFFLIGSQVARHPELVEQIARHGHELGNHSYNHCFMPMLLSRDLEKEIADTNERISEITGCPPPVLFRPPYGLMDQRAADCLKERSMKAVYWGSAPEDWSQPGSHRVIRRVMWRVSQGTLIVLHEGHLLGHQTAAAAKEIIYRCKNLGYRMAKVEMRA